MSSLQLFGLPFIAFLALSPCSSAQATGIPRPALATNCQAHWLPTFGGCNGMGDQIHSFATFDDGSGAALYAGGEFRDAGGVAAAGIAKWNGAQWSALGSGLSGSATMQADALCVFDDGSGPALYVGGSFTSAGGVPASRIAKWDGSSWSALGNGLNSYVYALTVFDDGQGPELYAGGWFVDSGGLTLNSIARWDGSAWASVGGGMNGGVNALCVFDDGSGPALYAGGQFTTAGGVTARGIAKWRAGQWSGLGITSYFVVNALEVFDDGTGRALYAGGYFTQADGAPGDSIARWDGANWSPLGLGMDPSVDSLAVYDDGSGAALYAAGQFSHAGGQPVESLAKWDGQSWSALSVELHGWVRALAAFDDGSGPALFVGGEGFTTQSDRILNNVGRWNGAQWSPLGESWSLGVQAAAPFDAGTGSALYVSFPMVPGMQAGSLRAWDGASWSSVPGAPGDATIRALTPFDDGSGPALYVGGGFALADGVPVHGIARWNGSQWSALGSGVSGGNVQALCVYDDGSGPALYVGGLFTQAGGLPASGVARWNGLSWSALGSGLTDPGYVSGLCTYDDGSGTALYAAGSFLNAGGSSASSVARWNGASWSALGSGLGIGGGSSLCVYDDGSGPALFVGGSFAYAGGVPANRIASWRAGSWSTLGSGVGPAPFSNAVVFALSTFDSGQGQRLIACGSFATAGGAPAANIASWDGAQWSNVGGGMGELVRFLQVWDDGRGPALYAGGAFRSCIDSGDSFLAKWGELPGCGYSGAVVCEPGVGGVSACPCANPPVSAGRGCDNSSATGGAALDALGQSSLLSDTLVFAASGEKPSALSIVLQANALDASGILFGQGVRCLTGALRRLYVETASGGSITAPGAGDASVSARSAQLGDPIAPGSQRHYGVYYRDPQVLGGCPATSTFNITQQLCVLWQP